MIWKQISIITTFSLRRGSNRLEIDVTNLWINRLIGDEQYSADVDWVYGGDSMSGSFLNNWPEWLANDQPRPSAARVTFTTWKHFNANDSLAPSGLIGPVTLSCSKLIPVQVE